MFDVTLSPLAPSFWISTPPRPPSLKSSDRNSGRTATSAVLPGEKLKRSHQKAVPLRNSQVSSRRSRSDKGNKGKEALAAKDLQEEEQDDDDYHETLQTVMRVVINENLDIMTGVESSVTVDRE